jgi:hypothetical protein
MLPKCVGPVKDWVPKFAVEPSLTSPTIVVVRIGRLLAAPSSPPEVAPSPEEPDMTVMTGGVAHCVLVLVFQHIVLHVCALHNYCTQPPNNQLASVLVPIVAGSWEAPNPNSSPVSLRSAFGAAV